MLYNQLHVNDLNILKYIEQIEKTSHNDLNDLKEADIFSIKKNLLLHKLITTPMNKFSTLNLSSNPIWILYDLYNYFNYNSIKDYDITAQPKYNSNILNYNNTNYPDLNIDFTNKQNNKNYCLLDNSDSKDNVESNLNYKINAEKKSEDNVESNLNDFISEKDNNNLNSSEQDNFNEIDCNDKIEIIIKKISLAILTELINSKYLTIFPKTLFNNNFMNYIVSNKLFFEINDNISLIRSVFGFLLRDIEYIKYFNIEYNDKYIVNYINYSNKLIKTLKEDVYTHIIPETNLVNTCISFLYLMNKYYFKCEGNLLINSLKGNKDYINYKSKPLLRLQHLQLKKNTHNLYIILYNSLCEASSINIESLNIYEQIYNSTNSYTVNSLISSIRKQTSVFNTCINNLIELKFYYKNLFYDIKNLEHDNPNYTNLILSLIYSVNNNYGLPISIYEKSNMINNIMNLFISDNTNIHSKTKILLEVPPTYFKKYLYHLIKLFLDVEKYNSTSGYTDKSKLRTKICTILYDFYDEDVFIKLKIQEYDDFITLYMSHLMSRFNEISSNKINCTLNKNASNSDKIYLVKNILSFDKSFEIIKIIKNISRLPKYCNNFLGKLEELCFTILNSSFKSKLYSETSLFKNSRVSNNILSKSVSKTLDNIYKNFFLLLDEFSNSESFITCISKNETYLDKKLLYKTNLLFSEFIYKDSKSSLYSYKVKYLINNLNLQIKKQLKDALVIKYDSEIPERYIDNILYVNIQNPYEIPETQEIVDKYTIINHLTFSETNPFTNNTLTREQLQKYNKQIEVKNRIEMFKEDFNTWKVQHRQL